MSSRIAIYPGTFDPVTNGHLDIIRRAARLVDRLVIGVSTNAGKGPLFSIEERIALIKSEVAALDLPAGNGVVEIRAFDTLLMHFAESVGARMILRGLRAVSDFEYEFQMALMNRHLTSGRLETVFMVPSLDTTYISSSIVREVARYGGNIQDLVHPRVAEALRSKFRA